MPQQEQQAMPSHLDIEQPRQRLEDLATAVTIVSYIIWDACIYICSIINKIMMDLNCQLLLLLLLYTRSSQLRT